MPKAYHGYMVNDKYPNAMTVSDLAALMMPEFSQIKARLDIFERRFIRLQMFWRTG